MRERVTISKQFRFEASHILPRHPGKCARLHGHSWLLTVAVRGEVNPLTGFVMDYGDLKKVVEETVVNRVDHQHLGAGEVVVTGLSGYTHTQLPVFTGDFYPSSENLVRVFAGLISPRLPEGVELASVELNETCTSAARWEVEK